MSNLPFFSYLAAMILIIESMKKRVLITVICLTAVSAMFARPEKPETDKERHRLEAHVAELDSRIALAELELNRLTWEKFLERAENSGNTIDIQKIGGLDRSALCDTVPELKQRVNDITYGLE